MSSSQPNTRPARPVAPLSRCGQSWLEDRLAEPTVPVRKIFALGTFYLPEVGIPLWPVDCLPVVTDQTLREDSGWLENSLLCRRELLSDPLWLRKLRCGVGEAEIPRRVPVKKRAALGRWVHPGQRTVQTSLIKYEQISCLRGRVQDGILKASRWIAGRIGLNRALPQRDRHLVVGLAAQPPSGSVTLA